MKIRDCVGPFQVDHLFCKCWATLGELPKAHQPRRGSDWLIVTLETEIEGLLTEHERDSRQSQDGSRTA